MPHPTAIGGVKSIEKVIFTAMSGNVGTTGSEGGESTGGSHNVVKSQITRTWMKKFGSIAQIHATATRGQRLCTAAGAKSGGIREISNA